MSKKVNSEFVAETDNVLSLPSLVTNVTLLHLVTEVEELKSRQKATCEMAARSILHALDFKDHYTFGHSMRVAFYSLILGRELQLSDEEMYKLELSALFHDIGKIGVPDAILLKPTRLTDEEMIIMQSHPVKSAEILAGFEDFEEIAVNAKHHHERFDGQGYPNRYAGEDIPLFSRIILIADTFDAMTSSRPYRKGLPYSTAFAELDKYSGSQFDPNLVKHFQAGMKKDQEQQRNTFSLKIINGQFNKAA